jgi:histidinol dehydrogenase
VACSLMLSMRFIEYPSVEFSKFTKLSQQTPSHIQKSVAKILQQVQEKGDSAVIELTRRFDGAKLTSSQLRVKQSQLQRAKVSKELAQAASQTLREVEAFARASLPKSWTRMNGHGARVGEKFDSIRRVGIYVPGGSVPLVSTVFMTVALARVAGVPEVVVCTPPPIAPEILWACLFCGATEVYQIGGAQAMAAMAYGIKAMQPVDKLFGPGNAYVTEAKRQLFGTVGIDLIAGPSELMVIADETVNHEWAAADLLAQAEHGSGRERIFCVSHKKQVLQRIWEELLRSSWEFKNNRGLQNVLKDGSLFILVRKPEQVAEVANIIAPEHLQIMAKNSKNLVEEIRTAGGIFLGNYTPTVLGDFVAGPSHTLPTSGAGKSFSGLRVSDFMRRTSVVEYSKKAILRARSTVAQFSKVEQLVAHGNSSERRF